VPQNRTHVSQAHQWSPKWCRAAATHHKAVADGPGVLSDLKTLLETGKRMSV
jgi:hypothetical protein